MDNMDVDSPGPLYVRLLAPEFKTRAFSINRHLSRYFTNPIAFRSLQARTNTLVSGSTALQFFDRTLYPESDLDLYTHPGHSFEVARFLVQDEGYRYVPRESQEGDWKVATSTDPELTARRVAWRTASELHAYPTTDIQAVWSFEKEDDGREARKQRLIIQIIEAVSSPFESILGFHSTCVMNFISSDAAYALYPMATLEHRTTLALPKSASSSTAIEKYAKRGWRIYFVPALTDHAFFLERARWVSDKHTWVLPLDQTGVQARPPPSPNSAPLPCDPVLFNGWLLKPCSKEDEGLEVKGDGYRPHYYPLKSTLFRYNYALPDERMQLTIREWTLRQGRFSHVHVSKEDWAWFDSDVPNFLRMRVQATHGDGRIIRVELGAPRALA